MSFGVFNIVPMDFIILLAMWIVFSVVALQGGRGEVLSMMFGAFVATGLFEYSQKAYFIGDLLTPFLSQPRNAAIMLLVLAVAGYLLTRQLMLPYGSDLIGSPTQSAVIGFLTTVILLAIWVIYPHTSDLWRFGSLFQTAFAPIYTFWWIAGALGLMIIFG